jgi:hypothetical protein
LTSEHTNFSSDIRAKNLASSGFIAELHSEHHMVAENRSEVVRTAELIARIKDRLQDDKSGVHTGYFTRSLTTSIANVTQHHATVGFKIQQLEHTKVLEQYKNLIV